MKFSIEYANVFSNILAKENIRVSIDASLETACFDLEARVLYLPAWDGSRQLQRFLLCHEISHAIFTPAEEWLNAIRSRPKNSRAVYRDILNVFEDARIDRLMPQRYVAMKKWYAEGIHELIYELDLWRLQGDLVAAQAMSLIDRLNLYFKTMPIGNPYELRFTSDEQIWIDRTNAAKTFDEIKQIADDFFKKLPEEEKTSDVEIVLQVGVFGGEGEGKKCQVKTLQALEKLGIKIAVIESTPQNQWYNRGHVVVPDSDFNRVLTKAYSFEEELPEDTVMPAKQLINRMVSVFQRKKNARLYARNLMADTGMLDPLKLHTYRYNDDVMLRRTIVDRQKNHGFVIYVDMSGSMKGVWENVVEHLYLLTMFCKQLSMPFEAYGFQDSPHTCELIECDFGLVPLLSSADPASKILSRALRLKNRTPESSTPLSSTIHYAKTMVLDFMERNRIDIMNTIFITDGGCTDTIYADNYTDKKSNFMVDMCENYLGYRNSVGPLMKILRHRTGSNVWVYHIGNGGEYEYRKTDTCTGAFFIGRDLMKNNPKIFIDDITEKMSVFGGSI
jgi:hypothetical protein